MTLLFSYWSFLWLSIFFNFSVCHSDIRTNIFFYFIYILVIFIGLVHHLLFFIILDIARVLLSVGAVIKSLLFSLLFFRLFFSQWVCIYFCINNCNYWWVKYASVSLFIYFYLFLFSPQIIPLSGRLYLLPYW